MIRIEILLLGFGFTLGAITIAVFWLLDRWFSRHYPKDDI